MAPTELSGTKQTEWKEDTVEKKQNMFHVPGMELPGVQCMFCSDPHQSFTFFHIYWMVAIHSHKHLELTLNWGQNLPLLQAVNVRPSLTGCTNIQHTHIPSTGPFQYTGLHSTSPVGGDFTSLQILANLPTKMAEQFFKNVAPFGTTCCKRSWTKKWGCNPFVSQNPAVYLKTSVNKCPWFQVRSPQE